MRRVLRRLYRGRPWHPKPSPGYVDLTEFNDEIAKHRARGVRIGNKVRLLGHIDSVNPHLVSVGDYTVLGQSSALLTHCPIHGARPVSVGAYSYIAFGALILPGVAVGDFCVVGAGAVVTKSVPDGSIVAGNPARVLRQLTPAERQHLKDVMETGKYFGWDPVRHRVDLAATAAGAE